MTKFLFWILTMAFLTPAHAEWYGGLGGGYAVVGMSAVDGAISELAKTFEAPGVDIDRTELKDAWVVAADIEYRLTPGMGFGLRVSRLQSIGGGFTAKQTGTSQTADYSVSMLPVMLGGRFVPYDSIGGFSISVKGFYGLAWANARVDLSSTSGGLNSVLEASGSTTIMEGGLDLRYEFSPRFLLAAELTVRAAKVDEMNYDSFSGDAPASAVLGKPMKNVAGTDDLVFDYSGGQMLLSALFSF